MKQRDNISGFEAMHLAMEDESLEISWNDARGTWFSYEEIDLDGMHPNQELSVKDYSIRKRETNLDKAVKEGEEIFNIEPKYRKGMTLKNGLFRDFLSQYIKD